MDARRILAGVAVGDLGRMLVETGALQFGKFKLSSGKQSSYYVDLRLIPSFPEIFDKVVSMYRDLFALSIGLKHVDAIAAVPIAGMSYASVLAHELRKPLVWVRREKKQFGSPRSIEGIIPSGARIVILDDLITTGDSIIASAETLRSEGGLVSDAIVLIDRMEGGIDLAGKNNIKVHALVGITEIARALVELQIIDENQYISIQQQSTGVAV